MILGGVVEGRARRKVVKRKKERRAPAGTIGAGTALQTDWQTPKFLLLPVRKVLGIPIPLDPCTSPDNPTRAERFYTVLDDGLVQPWDAPTFANPPYGEVLPLWMARAVDQSLRWRVPIVMLLPCSRFEQPYMHELLLAASTVCWIRKRVPFRNPATGDLVSGGTYANMFLGLRVPWRGPRGWRRAFGDVGCVQRLGG